MACLPELMVDLIADLILHFRDLMYMTIYMCCIMRKPAFCLCENKGADQLRGNRAAKTGFLMMTIICFQGKDFLQSKGDNLYCTLRL